MPKQKQSKTSRVRTAGCGVLYPIEMKKHIHCDKGDIAAFKQLDRIPDMERGEGCVVCMADDVFPITATDKAVGVRFL